MSQKCHSILAASRGSRAADAAAGCFDFSHGHIIPQHAHPEDQLIFASEGVMTVRTGQGSWVVPPLRAVWIPAHTLHAVTMSGIVRMRTLYFRPKLGGRIPRRCFVMNVSPLLRELILHACRFQRLSRRHLRQRRLLDVIFDQLEAVDAIPLQLPHPSDPRAMRVVRALYADPANTRSLAALSRESGASKRTLERLFTDQTRMTFGRWRRQFRLMCSMQAIAAGEKVSAAALEAGYSSTSAFISMFRRQLGTTPVRYFASGERAVRGESIPVTGPAVQDRSPRRP